MIVKNRYYYNFNYILNSSMYKTILFMLFFMNLYLSGCLTSNLMFTESLIKIFFYPYYYIIFLFFVLLITLKTNQYMRTNYFQLIRFDKYENYLNYEVKQIVYNISSFFMFNLITLLIMLILFNVGQIDLNNTIDCLFSFIFYAARFYVFALFYSVINALLFNIIGSKKMLLANLLILAVLPNYLFLLPHIRIDNFNSIPILFLELLGSQNLFADFSMEICVTMGHILLLSILYSVLYNWHLKQNHLSYE